MLSIIGLLSSHAYGIFAGAVVGVYTSASQWYSYLHHTSPTITLCNYYTREPIMGKYTGGSEFPLWYAHYDGNPSFSDFSPFNGWSKPSIKVSESFAQFIMCCLLIKISYSNTEDRPPSADVESTITGTPIKKSIAGDNSNVIGFIALSPLNRIYRGKKTSNAAVRTYCCYTIK